MLITDSVLGSYHGAGAVTIGVADQYNGRFTASLVTGSHNFKTGFSFLKGSVSGQQLCGLWDQRAAVTNAFVTNNSDAFINAFATPTGAKENPTGASQ